MNQQNAPESIVVSADLINRYFVRSLLSNMKQGVGFVDVHGTLLIWNQAAESVSGLRAAQMIGQPWNVDKLPCVSMVTCRSDNSEVFDCCPVSECLATGGAFDSRIVFEHEDESLVSAEMKTFPLLAENGQCLGTVLMLDDLSSEKELMHQVRQLNRQMTLDPLTQVPNRVEFDRILDESLNAYRDLRIESSLVICDIDFFKRINDDYGHEKGDQALIAFASHLQNFVRGDDLVARYGGEEFVIVFRDCNLTNAVERAEAIRRSLEVTPQDDLDGKCLTASFGVAQVLEQDCPKSIFVRADHALLNAKSSGRNCVISTDTKDFTAPSLDSESSIEHLQWKAPRQQPLVQEQYETPTPPDILLTKIRGFIEEQSATIKKVEKDFVSLNFGGSQSLFRRGADQSIGLSVDIEMKQDAGGVNGSRGQQTVMRCSVRPRRARDRRQKELLDAANHLLSTLRSYLMIPHQPAKPERAATTPGEGRS